MENGTPSFLVMAVTFTVGMVLGWAIAVFSARRRKKSAAKTKSNPTVSS